MSLLNVAELQALTATTRPQIVDIRVDNEFDSGHIPGAIHIPMEALESRLADLDRRVPTVLVCHAGDRATVAHAQIGHVFENIHILCGGTSAWIRAGYDVVRTARMRKSLYHQALIGASILNASGVVLAIFVHPYWIGINAFVSCGLMAAGSVSFCLMGRIMAVMPWNRPAPSRLEASESSSRA